MKIYLYRAYMRSHLLGAMHLTILKCQVNVNIDKIYVKIFKSYTTVNDKKAVC